MLSVDAIPLGAGIGATGSGARWCWCPVLGDLHGALCKRMAQVGGSGSGRVSALENVCPVRRIAVKKLSCVCYAAVPDNVVLYGLIIDNC